MKFKILSVLVIILPFKIKRIVYNFLFGYEISPTSYIGYSWISVESLKLGDGAYIGHLNMIKNLECLTMGSKSRIGHQNIINAAPKNDINYCGVDRRTEFLLGEGATITRKHFIDCTDVVAIGKFTTMAGYGSEILTHSINIESNRQSCSPVSIGDYCLLGSRVELLQNSKLPSYCVLGACSLLNKSFEDEYLLYGGVPARSIKSYKHEDCSYFTRENPEVY